MNPPGSPESLRILKPVYGGDGLAHSDGGRVVFVPFALPGELVEQRAGAKPRVLEASAYREEPRCVHFGVCGGCQYQMAAYEQQLAMKQDILAETLKRAGLSNVLVTQAWPSPQAWGYRNRIRLRVRRVEGAVRLGYSMRNSNEFLPVVMCPIAAPLLFRAVEAVVRVAQTNPEAEAWLDAAAEVEVFCDAEETKLQMQLLCTAKAPQSKGSFERFAEQLRAVFPELTGAGAARLDPRSGRALEPLAAWGAAGLPYIVRDETYWVTRGGFFQVNRFLLPAMVRLVCGGRSGLLAWDLFAGVGLFSRVLARSFGAVTAVEANPIAHADLARALEKIGAQHRAVQATTLDFLRHAVLQRDRPDLVVLDPPRAGAGEEACRLLARLSPAEIVYVSCDPTTLARDLVWLTSAGYIMAALHCVDLFPQTYHLETVMVLHRAV